MLNDIIHLLLFGLLVFVWNKYIVPNLVKMVVRINSGNKWLERNQNNITKGFQGFYWFGLMGYTLTVFLSFFK